MLRKLLQSASRSRRAEMWAGVYLGLAGASEADPDDDQEESEAQNRSQDAQHADADST